MPDYIGQTRFPDLYFNVSMQRTFLNPFVSNRIPLAVLFFVAWLSHTDLRRQLAAPEVIQPAAQAVVLAADPGAAVRHHLRGVRIPVGWCARPERLAAANAHHAPA
jgi:hypothetical protein